MMLKSLVLGGIEILIILILIFRLVKGLFATIVQGRTGKNKIGRH